MSGMLGDKHDLPDVYDRLLVLMATQTMSGAHKGSTTIIHYFREIEGPTCLSCIWLSPRIEMCKCYHIIHDATSPKI